MQAVIAADAGGGLCSMVFRLMASHRLSYGRCSGEVDISRRRSSAHPWASTPSRFRPRSLRFALTWLEFRYSHLGFDRVGNETILVCGMVHFVELFCAGCSISIPGNLRAARHE
jgi:hypothetical protein